MAKKKDAPPIELWMVWNQTDKCWLAAEDNDGNSGWWLVFATETLANEAVGVQDNAYGVKCRPVRVK